jgi:hypothetical protein
MPVLFRLGEVYRGRAIARVDGVYVRTYYYGSYECLMQRAFGPQPPGIHCEGQSPPAGTFHDSNWSTNAYSGRLQEVPVLLQTIFSSNP